MNTISKRQKKELPVHFRCVFFILYTIKEKDKSQKIQFARAFIE